MQRSSVPSPHPNVQTEPEYVPIDKYRYALTNFGIAHQKVEQQRIQLQEQEKQIALLRTRIAALEGGLDEQQSSIRSGAGSIDDFSIRSTASRLEKLINRWAADIVYKSRDPQQLLNLSVAALNDIVNGSDFAVEGPSSMQVQNLLRHAMSEAICEGIFNCLLVTNSSETNIQLTHIHEQLFARDPVVACVWRRQTFSAAVESWSAEMSVNILQEQLPAITRILCPSGEITPVAEGTILESAYNFSRMLHASSSATGGNMDMFYRAFVPELGSPLDPHQVELIRRCTTSERGESDRIGAVVFPGLVKVSKGPVSPSGASGDNIQTVIRRAQVVCECAMGTSTSSA